MSFSQFEREQISERTKTVLAHLKSNGFRTGSVPFGFDLARDGKKLLRNPREQRAIAAMVQWRQEGLSYESICGKLASREIPPKKGGQWRTCSVMVILKRRASNLH